MFAVAGLTDRKLFLIAVIIYGVSTLCCALLWRKGCRQDCRGSYGLLAVGFLFHSAAMLLRGLQVSKCPIYNLYEATLFLLWFLLAGYLALGVWRRWRFLATFVAPVLLGTGIFTLMPALDPPAATKLTLAGVGTSLHATLSLLAYGAFAFSAVAGMMFLVQERDLKERRVRALFTLLPPMDRLEQVVAEALLCGFGFLTLGLLMGTAGLKHLEGTGHLKDPKVLWSVLVWLLYGTMVFLRWRLAHRGRRLAFGAIGCFTFVLLTFWGTNLLSTIHNPVTQQKERRSEGPAPGGWRQATPRALPEAPPTAGRAAWTHVF